MKIFKEICNLVLRFVDITSFFHPVDFTSGVYLSEDFHQAQSPIIAVPAGDNVQYSVNQGCNTPDNRQQWCQGKSIKTDYEDISLTPTGVIRQYYLEIERKVICPDGYCVNATLINGTYPGPTLKGNWGDWFNITIKNSLTNCQGTSIHWHGLRQWNTFYADGVPGVTQCPFKPGSTMTYMWHATQYGSTWYHSHYSLQYADGVVAPLVLYGPTSANYDYDGGPLLITDWYHTDAFSLYPPVDPAGNPPDSVLINGMGNFTQIQDGAIQYVCQPAKDPNCKPELASLYTTKVEYGKRYKFRIINTSVTTHLNFWIDNHTLEVVSTDFVPVEPFNVKYLTVAIGQRYEVIVHANASLDQTSNFWINMVDCLQDCKTQVCTQGILSYDVTPSTPSVIFPVPAMNCTDADATTLHPVVPKNAKGIPATYTSENAAAFKYLQVNLNNDSEHWSFNKSNSFNISWEDPSLTYILDDQIDKFPTTYVPISIDGNSTTWVAFIIEGAWAGNDTLPVFQMPHPIHLHGHDYALLYQSDKPFNSSATYDLTVIKPPRRDVVMLLQGGFIIIAFPTDNPGPWLMHCHIAWHASAGLALQFIERAGDIPSLLGSQKAGYLQQCEEWNQLCDGGCKQEDSGI